MYFSLREDFNEDSENPVILYYLCLASLLTKKVTQCKQTIKFFKAMHNLNHTKKSPCLVTNYYLAKIKNVEKLLAKMPKSF